MQEVAGPATTWLDEINNNKHLSYQGCMLVPKGTSIHLQLWMINNFLEETHGEKKHKQVPRILEARGFTILNLMRWYPFNLGKIPNLNITFHIKESFTLSYQPTEKGSPPAKKTLFLLDFFLPSVRPKYIPSRNKSKYPTRRESRKIIDSNIPAGWGYIRSIIPNFNIYFAPTRQTLHPS